jgi:signal transduction histidine kinase
VESVVRLVGRPEVPIEVVPPMPEELWLDRRKVERVLANLLENADRYAGGATGIELSAHNGTFRLAVDDAGPGVPPPERALIFDRFHRGTATAGAAETDRGTGLGLALVAEHCRVHGGRAWVEAGPDGGARFVAEFATR